MEVRRGVRNEAVGTLRVSSERRASSESGNPFWISALLGRALKNQPIPGHVTEMKLAERG